ncbi:hypothetical protein V8G54_011615 [Vigna mungo]|uniref:Uncharacterized protein n=1 Tax=Vigna mungo TaxID=3915 RepID=A0AAQ3RZS6_VIGMU
MGSLTNLRYLNLSYSSFGGSIPTQFGSLIHLRYLDLSYGYLDGKLPCQLGNMSQLRYLGLNGHIPNGFEKVMNSLEVVDLSDQSPMSIGSLSELEDLYLDGNCLEGDVSSFKIFQIKHIQYLDLSRNMLSERVPSCLNNLTAMIEEIITWSETSIILVDMNGVTYASVPTGDYTLNISLMWKGLELWFKNPELQLKLNFNS